MNINNLIILTEVFLGYSVLVFGLSAFFLKPLLNGVGFTKGFLACFLAGNFYVMNVTFFLLLFFHCSSRFLTIFFLIAGACVLRMIFDFRTVRPDFGKASKNFRRLIGGRYGWHLFFRRLRRALFGNVREGLRFVFIKHQMDVGGVLFCLLIHGSYTARRLILYSGYGGYDEVVHASWVQKMMGGEIYGDGVYPFGFHEMIYATAKVFGIHAQQVLRDFGFITVVYMALMLYCMVAVVLENRLIAFATTFFYAAVCIFVQFSWDRLGFGYPQEFGLVFLYPMAIFLFYYFRQKDRFSLVFFGMAFSMTLYVHYYITIIALLLCFSIGIVYLIYIWKKKMLIPILICGIVSSLIGASTMVLGVATGHRLQGSLYWALGVIEGDDGEEAPAEELSSQEGEDSGGLVSMGGVSPGAVSPGAVSAGSLAAGTKEPEESEESRAPKEPLLKRLGNAAVLVGSNIKKYCIINCVTEHGFWGFTALTIASLLLGIYYLTFGKKRLMGAFILSFVIYILLLAFLMSTAGMGLPVIIEDYRVRVFLCYALPFTIGVFLHSLWMIAENVFLSGKKEKESWRRGFRRYGMIPISIFMLVTLVSQNLIRQPSRSIVIQQNEIVDVFYHIIDNYDDFSWTLVSDVQEYAMCLENGYHYEWTELLTHLSSGTLNIVIPTKYVFFAIEKRPIDYGTVIETGQNIPIQGEVSRKHAMEGFDLASVGSPDKLYVQYRLQVMSKAYYWAKAYAELFPEEMKVYYEDENVIYYCLTQEPYYLNNLKIDYGYNSLLPIEEGTNTQPEGEKKNAVQPGEAGTETEEEKEAEEDKETEAETGGEGTGIEEEEVTESGEGSE